MQFINDTRINPEAVADSIPVIGGHNYYIDEKGFVSTYNLQSVEVFDETGNAVRVKSIQPVTEFISIVNNLVAYHTSKGILVTTLPAPKEKYIGGFQGIVGFNENEVSYQYINSNSTLKSGITLTGRINSSKQLEIYLSNIDTWIVPLGEFRCFIDDTLYTIGYSSTLPNSFGTTFNVELLGWTSVTLGTTTDYIRDMLIAGNTLYISTRLRLLGSTPYDWSSVSTTESTVIYSEDSRLIGGYFIGEPTASYFYVVNYNTSSIYWIDAQDFKILQEYTHKIPILGTGCVDKFTIAVVDKESVTIIGAYVSLNTWLMKARAYFAFNQLSAYEDMVTQYLREDVEYVTNLDSLIIKSTQRANMILYILNNKVLSGCHTETQVIAGNYGAYIVDSNSLYKYTRVEDGGEYEPIDIDTGKVSFDSCIYIGSDLEPDVGGSTMRDTEILFEGKITLLDGDTLSVESSSDTPEDNQDLPVRTNQSNPENWWYLYSKTLRYPVSYTDWMKISLMPTTKIFNITLAADPTQQKKGGK